MKWKRTAKGQYASGEFRIVQHRLTSADGRRSGLLWELQARGRVVERFTFLAEAKEAAARTTVQP